MSNKSSEPEPLKPCRMAAGEIASAYQCLHDAVNDIDAVSDEIVDGAAAPLTLLEGGHCNDDVLPMAFMVHGIRLAEAKSAADLEALRAENERLRNREGHIVSIIGELSLTHGPVVFHMERPGSQVVEKRLSDPEIPRQILESVYDQLKREGYQDLRAERDRLREHVRALIEAGAIALCYLPGGSESSICHNGICKRSECSTCGAKDVLSDAIEAARKEIDQ